MNYAFIMFLFTMFACGGCAGISAKTSPTSAEGNSPEIKSPAEKSSSKESIMQSYLSKVNKSDGINKEEAILLSQSQIIFRGTEQNYHLNNPQLAFENEESYGIKFLPKTKDANDPPVLIVITKKDGRVHVYLNSPKVLFKKQDIEYQDGDTMLQGYLVYDESLSGKRPGVLVVHEWKGLGDYAKRRADQLAELGYVAFAVDMYGKGIRPETNEDAAKQAGIYKQDRQLMRRRANAGLEVLKNQPLVDPKKIAAIGYCFGGTTVLELARSAADLKGVVSFHGGLQAPLPEDAKNIKGKVLALHGADDPFVKPQEVDAFEKEMKAGHVDYKLVRYPGAVHSFTNPDSGNDPAKGMAYNQEADKKSWVEMKAFLKKIGL